MPASGATTSAAESPAWSLLVNDPAGESSGIVNASDWLEQGARLLDVQAHGTYIDTELQPDGVLHKREAGQSDADGRSPAPDRIDRELLSPCGGWGTTARFISGLE